MASLEPQISQTFRIKSNILALPKFIIPKIPFFENDSMFFIIRDFHLTDEQIALFLEQNPYAKFKYDRFKQGDLYMKGWEEFKDYPSFKKAHEYTQSVDHEVFLDFPATNYICNFYYKNFFPEIFETCDLSLPPNYLAFYSEAMKLIKEEAYKDSRRLIINFCDNLENFSNQLHNLYSDYSCLSSIQYMNRRVNISFRAIDLQSEFINDLFLIYVFFLKDVYSSMVTINFYSATVQHSEYASYIYTQILKRFNFIE